MVKFMFILFTDNNYAGLILKTLVNPAFYDYLRWSIIAFSIATSVPLIILLYCLSLKWNFCPQCKLLALSRPNTLKFCKNCRKLMVLLHIGGSFNPHVPQKGKYPYVTGLLLLVVGPFICFGTMFAGTFFGLIVMMVICFIYLASLASGIILFLLGFNTYKKHLTGLVTKTFPQDLSKIPVLHVVRKLNYEILPEGFGRCPKCQIPFLIGETCPLCEEQRRRGQ